MLGDKAKAWIEWVMDPDGVTTACCTGFEALADLKAMQAQNARMRNALEWYRVVAKTISEYRVTDALRVMTTYELAVDAGQKAKEAIRGKE